MLSRVFIVAVATLSMCLTAHAAQLLDSHIIGAQFTADQGCKLALSKHTSTFLREYIPLLKAVTVADVSNALPSLVFYNKFKQEVERVPTGHMTAEEIIGELSMRDIHLWSPSPKYEQYIEPTYYCIAWRQTAGCDAREGKREEHNDLSCTKVLLRDQSGYCECVDGRKIHLECDREEFTSCDEQCQPKA